MNWIDIRVRKPTEADAMNGNVFAIYDNGYIREQPARFIRDGCASAIAWLDPKTLPKFTPIPDPPEGYRWATDSDEFDKRAKWWHGDEEQWVDSIGMTRFDPHFIYAVPIDPPKPQYRPFANAAEFEPYSDRWIQRRKQGEYLSGSYRVSGYDDMGVWGDRGLRQTYKEMFDDGRTFADGTPFGIKVE